MATVLYRYSDTQTWATCAPTVMSLKGAERVRERLISEGYQVKIVYL